MFANFVKFNVYLQNANGKSESYSVYLITNNRKAITL